MFRNLLIPETQINFSINIFLARTYPDLITFPTLNDHDTTTFLPLLKRIDKSRTINKITFLPIDYLRQKMEKELSSLSADFSSELEEKQFLYSIFKKKYKLTKEFLVRETINEIPLFYFKKPILITDFTYAKDSCFIAYKLNLKTYEEIGLHHDEIKEKHMTFKTNTKESYFNLVNMNHFNKLCNYMAHENVFFAETLIMCNNQIYINFKTLNTTKRFITGILLINEHYMNFIIDKECKGKSVYKKNLYMFNSFGFNENKVGYDKKYWYVDSNMELKRAKEVFKPNAIYRSAIQYLDSKFNFDNIFLNSFQNQFIAPECGMFVNYFNYLFYETISETKNLKQFNFRGILKLYNNVHISTSDLFMSMLRGIFFVTKDDLVSAKLDNNSYWTSLDVNKITNKKMLEFKKLYNEAHDRIKETGKNL